MPYEWHGSHAYRDHANGREIEPGDELPEDIAEQVADAHPHDVRAVDEGDSDEGDSDESDASGGESAAFDTDDWLAGDYEERAEAVRDGRVDAHLDAIEACETSETVIDAVEHRRADIAE